MSCFLTEGRRALLAALQVDPTLGATVKTWYDFGPGIQKRYDILPAWCPLLSLVPAELDEDQLANSAAFIHQDLNLGIATSGPDAGPCEELVAAALGVLDESNELCLGLAAQGLADLNPVALQWRAMPTEESPRLRWEAQITVRIRWVRRNR